jgi:hypothetical protein
MIEVIDVYQIKIDRKLNANNWRSVFTSSISNDVDVRLLAKS